MAKPIVDLPPSATARELVPPDSASKNVEAIIEELEQAGVWRFLRALLEQRKPISEMVMEKLDTEPTKRGLNNAVTLAMALGALPEGFGLSLMGALQSGFHEAQSQSQGPDADKMSIWQLMGMLKDPDVARAIHYLMGFLKGLGTQLGDPSQGNPGGNG